MPHRALFASSLFALVAALSLPACAPDDERHELADAATVTRSEADAASSDAEPEDAVYIAPGALTVRWSFVDSSASLASSCAARGVASVRVETGIGGAITVPCASGERRFEGLTAGTYSVVVEALDASGAVMGDDFYGVSTVRSMGESIFEVAF